LAGRERLSGREKKITFKIFLFLFFIFETNLETRKREVVAKLITLKKKGTHLTFVAYFVSKSLF